MSEPPLGLYPPRSSGPSSLEDDLSLERSRIGEVIGLQLSVKPLDATAIGTGLGLDSIPGNLIPPGGPPDARLPVPVRTKCVFDLLGDRLRSLDFDRPPRTTSVLPVFCFSGDGVRRDDIR